jgi:Ca2+-transporting ATPase
MTLALAQLFHLGNARSRGPVLAPRRAIANRWALAAVPFVLGLQVIAVHWTPLAAVLGTVPLSGRDWLVIVVLSSLPGIVGQIIETVTNRRSVHSGASPAIG